MEVLVLGVGLLLATVVVVAIGERVGLPWPVLLVLLTAGIIFIPGLPDIRIPASIMVPLFLPPLLWAMARRTSWSVIRGQKSTILSLSVLLVFASIAAGAVTAGMLMPGLSVAGAIVLASALAPPDPVAVDAVAEPAGVPRRLIKTLQTEGLFNDAAAIVAFDLGLRMLVAGDKVTFLEGFLAFLYSAIAAVAIGLVVGFGSARMLDWIQSPVTRNAFSWVIPFAVYLIAEEVHASGVIAIVIAAVEMHSRAKVGAEDRLTGHAFWETVEMLFTGVAFGLIGLSARRAIEEVGSGLWHGIYVGAVLSVVLVLVRGLWMYGVYRMNKRRGKTRGAPLRLQEVLLLTWSGMRGMVTLALVLSIPRGYVSWRHEMTIIALTVLTLTMVVPGLLLPKLMQWLDLENGPDPFGDKAREALLLRAREASTAVIHRRAEGLPPNMLSSIQHWIAEETGTEDLDEADCPEHADGTHAVTRADSTAGPAPVSPATAFAAAVSPGLVGAPVGPGRAAAGTGAGKQGEKPKSRQEKLREIRARANQVRIEALEAAQREVVVARREPGVDPAIADEVLHDIDRMILAARRA